MPFVEIQTQVAAEDPNAVLQRVSRSVSELLGKPESYVMTSWTQAIAMTFDGSREPCCCVRVALIGTPSSEAMTRLNQELCRVLSEAIAVPASRVFVVFGEVPRSHWGIRGSMLAT